MKTIEEKVVVYRAYLEGAEIERRSRTGTVWVPCTNPTFDWIGVDYRVKPEPVKPAVARAFKQKYGGIYWTLDEGHKPFNEDMRAPEFDIVAKEMP